MATWLLNAMHTYKTRQHEFYPTPIYHNILTPTGLDGQVTGVGNYEHYIPTPTRLYKQVAGVGDYIYATPINANTHPHLQDSINKSLV